VNGINIGDFKDTTNPGDDGYSGILTYARKGSDQARTLAVSLSGTEAAPIGLGSGGNDPKREQAMKAIHVAALAAALRGGLPPDAQLRLTKRDIQPGLRPTN
jgi:hypothetical protein